MLASLNLIFGEVTQVNQSISPIPLESINPILLHGLDSPIEEASTTSKYSSKFFDRMDQMFDSIDNNFLNPIGYIPFAGTISSPVRSNIGYSQVAVGAISSLFHFAIAMNSKSEQQMNKHLDLMDRSFEYVIHGALNQARALFEAVPFLALVTTLPYDLAYNPVLPYNSGSEENNMRQLHDLLKNRRIIILENKI